MFRRFFQSMSRKLFKAAVHGAARRKPVTRKLEVEGLESRQLMAGGLSVSLSQGILTIDGTDGNDLVQVGDVGTTVIVRENSTEVARFDTLATKIDRIEFNGHGGIDYFRNDTPIAVDFSGVGVYVDRGQGLLRVDGSESRDIIQMGDIGTMVLVRFNGDTVAQFDKTEVTLRQIRISGFGGNDELRNDLPVASSLYGGVGDDSLWGGAGADWLHGGAGDDLLHGNDGNDVLFGNAGNDYLAGGYGSDSTIQDDNVSYNPATGAIIVRGTDNDDAIQVGDADRNVVVRFGGNEVAFFAGYGLWLARLEVHGLAGNDDVRNETYLPSTMYGDAGNDTLIGNYGDDRIFGGDGDDRIYGKDGHDSALDGGAGADIIDGGAGDDDLNGGGGGDVMTGGPGADQYFELHTDAFITDPWREDIIPMNLSAQVGLQSNVVMVNGTDSADDVRINEAGDFFHVQVDGRNTYIPRSLASSLFARLGAGDDHVENNTSTSSAIFGGDGNDLLEGGYGNDALYGEAGNDRLHGKDGNDELRGGAGNDTLEGGNGADKYLEVDAGDQVVGLAGDDFISWVPNDTSVAGGNNPGVSPADPDGHGVITSRRARVEVVDGVLVVNGTASSDSIYISADYSNNYTVSFKGKQIGAVAKSRVWQKRVRIFGHEGNDTIRMDYSLPLVMEVHGGDGRDDIWGGRMNDSLRGNGDADTIHGDGGADFIDGGDGNDTLRGGNGNDRLMGGRGDDSLYGDAGKDYLYGGFDNDKFYADALDLIFDGSGKNRVYKNGKSYPV